MQNKKIPKSPILVVGDGKLAYSIAGMLSKTDHETSVLVADMIAAKGVVAQYAPNSASSLIWLSEWPDVFTQPLIIAITSEDGLIKQQLIQQLEDRLGEEAVIAINTESIPLEELQAESRFPNRILGLNWSYPADLTFFLEIISNNETNPHHVGMLSHLAESKWNKQAYIAKTGFSIRGRMMAAWAREAFYLVENGYASQASIDRACRNDAGYYLPFAGNFRYMDLMGTYAYGMVMKDLNPELSNATQIPTFIEQILEQDKSGVGPPVKDEGRLDRIRRIFTKEINELMQHYHIDEEKTDC